MNLHFACGPNVWPGFENSDIHGGEGTRYVDLEDRPLPYDDNTADVVMISHGLKFTHADGTPVHPDLPAILGEFHRILKPGGWLRIDDNPWRMYREGEPANTTEAEARYPDHLRVHRDTVIDDLRNAGFGFVTERGVSGTAIPCEGEVREALVGNAWAHRSFTLEAQK